MELQKSKFSQKKSQIQPQQQQQNQLEHKSTNSSVSNIINLEQILRRQTKDPQEINSLSKVFAFQLAYSFILLITTNQLIEDRMTMRWIYWRFFLNKLGPAFIALSILIKFVLRYRILKRPMAYILGILLDLFLTRIILVYFFFLKINQPEFNHQFYYSKVITIVCLLFINLLMHQIFVLWLVRISRKRVSGQIVTMTLINVIIVNVYKQYIGEYWISSIEMYKILLGFLLFNSYINIQVYFLHKKLRLDPKQVILELSLSIQTDIFYGFWKRMDIERKRVQMRKLRGRRTVYSSIDVFIN